MSHYVHDHHNGVIYYLTEDENGNPVFINDPNKAKAYDTANEAQAAFDLYQANKEKNPTASFRINND